jgi:hypothetical protein
LHWFKNTIAFWFKIAHSDKTEYLLLDPHIYYVWSNYWAKIHFNFPTFIP